jgi:hypothetical protein
MSSRKKRTFQRRSSRTNITDQKRSSIKKITDHRRSIRQYNIEHDIGKFSERSVWTEEQQKEDQSIYRLDRRSGIGKKMHIVRYWREVIFFNVWSSKHWIRNDQKSWNRICIEINADLHTENFPVT